MIPKNSSIRITNSCDAAHINLLGYSHPFNPMYLLISITTPRTVRVVNEALALTPFSSNSLLTISMHAVGIMSGSRSMISSANRSLKDPSAFLRPNINGYIPRILEWIGSCIHSRASIHSIRTLSSQVSA